MAVVRCNCSFCTGLAGNTSLYADSPAALSDTTNFGYIATVGAANASGAAMMAMVAGLPTSSTGSTGIVASSASTAGATTGSTAVPSWVSGLSTATIRADMTAADVNGTVTYAGLEKVFADVASALSTGSTTLTATQLADLKTIAANLNNGMTASPYLTYVSNALVNGNAANASWTGGATKSVALGNLAAGATATQVTELNGKWFLGSDLPNASVAMSGSSTFTVTYSIESKPLFAATGPSMGDINQGYLGDCYLLSSLAEVASQNAAAISSMITDNGNNTYGVRFYYNGAAEYVTVNNMMANGGNEFNTGPDMWASLVEKAYAQFQAINLDTGNTVNYGNAWSTIGNGGYPDNALEAITGASSLTDFFANGSTWFMQNYNASLNATSSSSGLSTATVLTYLRADLANGYDLVLSSNTNATDSSGKTTLVSDHALSIYGYDTATGNLEIRNPWGTSSSGQYWDTTFEVSLTTLLSAGDSITVANLPASTSSVVTNALVSAAAGLQADTSVTSFTIADTMANVAAGLTGLVGDTKLVSVTLTDSAKPALTLTAAQYAADTAILGKIVTPYYLTVTGAAVSGAAGLQSATAVTAFTLSDSLANVMASATALTGDSKLSAIVLTDATKPSLTLTAVQYTADTALLAKITSGYNLAVTGATAANAAGLQAAAAVTSFTVSDSAANVASALSKLIADTKLTSIMLTDAAKPTLTLTSAQFAADTAVLAKIGTSHNTVVTGATVATAASLQANAGVTSFTVADTMANISASLATLVADNKLTQIALTLTAAQYSPDAALLAKISGSYTLIVTGASASAAAGLQSAAAVTSFTVSDTAANITSALSSLNADTKLTSIVLTDASKPTFTLSSAVYTADAALMAKIASSYNLTVIGATAANAAGLQSTARVTSFTVSDTAANVTTALTSLNADTKLTSIVLTDASKPTFTLTSAQYTADTAALGKIVTSHNLTVTGASAAAAASLQSATGVTSFTVADSAANVTSYRTALNADTKLASLTVSGTTSGDTLTLTGSTIAANINLGGDTASASGGLASTKLTFIGTPDAIVLGTGASNINFTLASTGGIETIANFQYGLDHLLIDLHGAANSVLKAFDTTVNNVHAISLYSSADPSHGVVLLGMPTSSSAANLLASHLTFNNGVATIA